MRTMYKVIIAVVVVLVIGIVAILAALVYPFFVLVDSIEQIEMDNINEVDIQSMLQSFAASSAFREKHPDITSEEFMSDGSNYEFWLKSDDATLRVDYNKENAETDITYSCTNQDGNERLYELDPEDNIMPAC